MFLQNQFLSTDEVPILPDEQSENSDIQFSSVVPRPCETANTEKWNRKIFIYFINTEFLLGAACKLFERDITRYNWISIPFGDVPVGQVDEQVALDLVETTKPNIEDFIIST